MTKLELIKELLLFSDKMDEEIVVNLILRDTNGSGISSEKVKIDSIGHFVNGPTTINLTRNNVRNI